MLLIGDIGGVPTVFLPRHGRGHVHSPTTINYRANIDALKRCGVTDVISVSAVGSFRTEMAPGDFVLVDQFIDRTVNREKSFFGTGLVGHVGFGEPTCPRLRGHLANAAQTLGITAHQGGTYVAMEGPQFSTRAESLMYRNAWGAHVIGMTNMPEAKLAREAEMCYATVAMVTDYDSWHDDHGSVDIPTVLRTMEANSVNARRLVETVVPVLGGELECPAGCNRALDYAFLTAPDHRDPALLARLDAVAGRVLAAQ
jgi:5'-methylthioadenosine phosphorylase